MISKRFLPSLPLVRKGFTLTELIVSVAIMTVVSGITLSGGPQSIMRLTLADNVYRSELLIRESQLQGSAINSLDGLYGGSGVFFDLATSTKVLQFKDVVIPNPAKAIPVGNGIYDQGTDATTTILELTNSHRVGSLCVPSKVAPLAAPFYCNDNNPDVTDPKIKTLTISFSRPKQIAHIYVNGDTTTDYDSACIQFISPRFNALLSEQLQGYVRSILVYKSGMITKRVGTCVQ